MHKIKTAVIYTTCPSREIAELIADEVIKRGFGACVNIIPHVISIYNWDSKIQRDHEVVALIKTESKMTDEVISAVKELHPYDMPAIITIPIEGGCETFLRWITTQTGAFL